MIKEPLTVLKGEPTPTVSSRAGKVKALQSQSGAFSEIMKKALINALEGGKTSRSDRSLKLVQSENLRNTEKNKPTGKNKKVILFSKNLPEESRSMEALLKGLEFKTEGKEPADGKKINLTADRSNVKSKLAEPASTELLSGFSPKGERMHKMPDAGKNRGKNKEAPRAEVSLKPQTGELARLNLNLTSTVGKVSVVDVRKAAVNKDGGIQNKAGGSEKFQLTRGEALSDTSLQSKDARFAIAETSIEIDKEPGIKLNNESAAKVLSDKINGQAGSEIVRQVKVVLSQAQAGEIRITLHPENLGAVRVSIQMDDNQLTGKIFVDSIAARDAFRTTLDGLQAKLIESGFSSADIELLWDDRSSNRNFGHSHQDGQYGFTDEKSSSERQRAAEEFEVLADHSNPIGYEQINLVI